MSNRIVAAPSLSPTASPVSRYVAPVFGTADRTGSLDEVAQALAGINPELQRFIGNQAAENAQAQEAEGVVAEGRIDSRYRFARNRDAWSDLIKSTRKQDPEMGDRLAAASPHFRRGVMKARMNRLGMGLNDHLATLWSKNPEIDGQRLHDIDDPGVVSAWLQQQSAAYADSFGISGMDPLLVAETYTKHAASAQDRLLAQHTDHRLQRYQEDYVSELSSNAGLLLAGAGYSGASDVNDFLEKLGMSENSGRWSGTNPLGYTGKWQFGDGRIADFNRATGRDIRRSQLDGSPEGIALQVELAKWHISDIDRVIQEEGFLEMGYSLDGLRAVAHLGGIGGMKKFVQSGGEYDPHDGYTKADGTKVKGTHLSDYYRRFSGTAASLQQIADQAVADGVAPRKVNETIVSSVIASAEAARNPEALNVLRDIDTGNGPIGSVAWVQQAVTAAEERIYDRIWKDEERALKLEERERSERSLDIQVRATATVFNDPEADITSLQNEYLANGDPSGAQKLATLQQTLQERQAEVITDHEYVSFLRVGLSSGEISEEEFLPMVHDAVIAGLMPSSVATSLVDDFDNRERNRDLYNDRQVQSLMSTFASTVASRFKIDNGYEVVSNEEKRTEALFHVQQWVTDYIRENPEASPTELRNELRAYADRELKADWWQPNEAERSASDVEQIGRPFGQLRQDAETARDNREKDEIIIKGLMEAPRETITAWGDPAGYSALQFDLIAEAASRLGITEQQLLQPTE